MDNSDSQFEDLVSIIKSDGPGGYSLEETVEEKHVLFENDSENKSFNLMLMSSPTSDDTWVEIDLFNHGKIMDSKAFETEDEVQAFVQDDLEDELGNL